MGWEVHIVMAIKYVVKDTYRSDMIVFIITYVPKVEVVS